MILEAKYKGPFPEVTVPGFAGKVAHPGETHKIRIPDGHHVPGCWEITEGLDAYNQALEKAEQDARAEKEARDKRAAETLAKARANLPDETEAYLANGETDHTNTKGPKTKKSGGSKK